MTTKRPCLDEAGGIVACPAYADTSQASATALSLTGLVTGSTTPTTASNDGTQPNVTNTAHPLISVLPPAVQTIVNVGVLTQIAQSNNDGTSAACSGATGTNGTVLIGGPTGCDVTAGDPGGVTVKLGALNVLTAGAIIGACNANSDGTTSGHARFINASAVNGLVNVPLLDNPAPNTVVVGLAPVLSITQNVQTMSPSGSIQVTALQLTLLGTGQVVNIGQVTCGPNANTGSISSFPVKGLPIAGGIVVLAGGVLVYRRRRNAHAAL